MIAKANLGAPTGLKHARRPPRPTSGQGATLPGGLETATPRPYVKEALAELHVSALKFGGDEGLRSMRAWIQW
jgi:hypothetical protein